MLDQLEVERALDWRKGVEARDRKARWRGEDALLSVAVSRSLQRKRPFKAFAQPAAVEDLFGPDMSQGEIQARADLARANRFGPAARK